jgi:hypothetical protein
MGRARPDRSAGTKGHAAKHRRPKPDPHLPRFAARGHMWEVLDRVVKRPRLVTIRERRSLNELLVLWRKVLDRRAEIVDGQECGASWEIRGVQLDLFDKALAQYAQTPHVLAELRKVLASPRWLGAAIQIAAMDEFFAKQRKAFGADETDVVQALTTEQAITQFPSELEVLARILKCTVCRLSEVLLSPAVQEALAGKRHTSWGRGAIVATSKITGQSLRNLMRLRTKYDEWRFIWGVGTSLLFELPPHPPKFPPPPPPRWHEGHPAAKADHDAPAARARDARSPSRR